MFVFNYFIFGLTKFFTMKRFNLIFFLMNPKKWWIPLLIIFTISIAGVIMMGVHTYTEAPPLPNYVSSQNEIIFSKDDILKGQAVFQKYALMEYGSMFGDGANRGPDFTAEALHYVSRYMNDYYQQQNQGKAKADLLQKGAAEEVKSEIKNNRFNKQNNTVALTDAQAFAAKGLIHFYEEKFTNPSSEGAFKPSAYITNKDEIKSLTAFLFWGAWVCGVERPGERYSYTHNWPYDPAAGNTPSSAIILWSILGSMALIFGLGLVLYYH